MSDRITYNGAELEEDMTVSGDVVIIGTGAGGGITAEILSQAGLKVIMIEEGPYRTAKDFDLTELGAYTQLYFDGGLRKIKSQGIWLTQGRCVGGSTTIANTTCFRTPSETMNFWAENYGVTGFTAEQMAPYFDYVEERLHIQPWQYPPNQNNEALAQGAEKLGWSYGVSQRNVKNCIQLAVCQHGCPVNAKLSMLITTIPSALDQGAVLFYRVQAYKLEIKGDQVTAVECLALDNPGIRLTGKKVRVEAPFVVVAGGGINSPALLLRSEVPDPYQTLGKRTFLQIHNGNIAIMPEEVNGYLGAPQSIHCDEFVWRDGVSGKMGYLLETIPVFPATTFSWHKLLGQSLVEHVLNYKHIHFVIGIMRDGFNEQSTGGIVSLNDDGSPVLDYPLTDYVYAGLRDAYLSIAECQFAAGAKSVFPAHLSARPYTTWNEAKTAIALLPMKIPDLNLMSTHILGGCGMGEDPETSVVNSNGRHHQLGNVSVIDGSVFPTSLGVNPLVSICALAARWATQLAKELQ